MVHGCKDRSLLDIHKRTLLSEVAKCRVLGPSSGTSWLYGLVLLPTNFFVCGEKGGTPTAIPAGLCEAKDGVGSKTSLAVRLAIETQPNSSDMRYVIANSINPNVFPVYDTLDEDYWSVFSTLEDAQAYCDLMNQEPSCQPQRSPRAYAHSTPTSDVLRTDQAGSTQMEAVS